MLSKKSIIYTIIVLVIVSIVAFSFVRHQEISDIENQANTILQKDVPVIITNATGEERNDIARNYIKDKFDLMNEERKIEYVDKMYFSTCYEISDFCESGNYSDLNGCEYCEGR